MLRGGLSSRLFQQVREERGLAYSVYSTVDTFSDSGALSIYAACLPERFDEVTRLASEEGFRVVRRKALPVDGSYPSGTTQYEKRNISDIVAEWESESARWKTLTDGLNDVESAARSLRYGQFNTIGVILFGLCGHGHFDLAAYDAYLSGQLEDPEFSEADMEAALARLPEAPSIA